MLCLGFQLATRNFEPGTVKLCPPYFVCGLFLSPAGVTLAMASRKFSNRKGLLITKSTPGSGLPEDANISA